MGEKLGLQGEKDECQRDEGERGIAGGQKVEAKRVRRMKITPTTPGMMAPG